MHKMKHPLIAVYVVPLVMTTLLSVALFQFWQNQLREDLYYEQAGLANRGTSLMSRELGHIKQIMLYMGGELSERLMPANFPNEAAWRTSVEQYFARASGLSDYVSQIRWLAANGQEQVRVNVHDDRVELVSASDLQDKSNRYYFTEGMAAQGQTVVMTPIDLNIEHGNIVRPHEVTIRASIKLLDAHQAPIGLLVVNYNLNRLFARLRTLQSANNTLEMINNKGQWLLSSQPELEWLHLYGEILTSFSNAFPMGWQQVDQSRALTPVILQDGRPLSSLPVFVDDDASQVPYYFLSQVRPEVWRQHRNDILMAVVVLAVVVYSLVTFIGFLLWRNSEQQKRHLIQVTTEKVALEQAQVKLTEANRTLISLQDELVEKGRLSSLGLMVAGVGHELNTPLGGIRLSLSALQHLHSRIVPKVDENVAEVFESSTTLALQNLNRAVGVIEQFKRITQQTTYADVESFNVKAMLEDTLSPLKSVLKQHPDVQIETLVDPNLMLDSAQDVLSQVLQNLILNALEHAFNEGQSGVIRMTANQEDEFVIEVSDNGKGIPAELLASIWEPFVTTERGKKHSGLGLYMVHQWVTRLLGGRIEVRSDENGTRFTLFIPI